MTNEWQPIETAPKDGAEILVWGKGEGVVVAHWFASRLNPNGVWSDGSSWSGLEFQPTLWLPVPWPPKPVD